MNNYESYAPATFEERGCAIAFTTRLLAYCRIRKDYRDRLEVVLPNIVDGKGNYIVPWAALPQVMTLTAHDQALIEEVQTADAISPHDMRIAELKVASLGLAGPDAAAAATAALAFDEKCISQTNLMFMAKVIMASGSLSPEVVAGIATGESNMVIRDAAYKAAATIGLTPAQLDERLGELSKVVAPLGIESGSEQSRLRQIISDLGTFRNSLQRWVAENANGKVDLARFCIEIAGLTLDRGKTVTDEVENRIREPMRVLRYWFAENEKLRAAIVRLSWLFDGWEIIIRIWAAAQNDDRDAQETALLTIFRALPLLPKAEIKGSIPSYITSSRLSRQRSVQMYENWHTGEIDDEMITRIDGSRTRYL